MKITVNGESRDLEAGATVADLLRLLDLHATPCAAEVNREVVPRSSHGAHTLQDGDVVELVTLVGGG